MAANIVTREVASAQSSVMKFESNLDQLLNLLGKADVTVLPEGSAWQIYNTSGTMVTTQVADGAEITASTYDTTLAETKVITINKYRKLTGIGKVQSLGYEKAVERTNDALVRDVCSSVRKSLFDGIATGTGTATGAGLQAATAAAWAALGNKCEDEDCGTPIYFCNRTTAAGYLSNASVTIQTAFGLEYIENFLGLRGKFVLDSNVPDAEIWATTQENIEVIAPEVLGDFFDATDAQGTVGISVEKKNSNAAYETVVGSGVVCYPCFLDRVIKATVTA